MSDKPFVPVEPGFYFVTYTPRSDKASRRICANVEKVGNYLLAFANGHFFGISGEFVDSSFFSDWSPRITEPPPAPAAKEASELDPIARVREAIDKVNVTASAVVSLQDYRSAKTHVECIELLRAVVVTEAPALLDELEQLRGIVAMAREVIVDPHVSVLIVQAMPPRAWEIRVDGIDIDQTKEWPSISEALAYLRTDAGKAAVAAAKGAR